MSNEEKAITYSIKMSESLHNTFETFAKKSGMSFSQFLRTAGQYYLENYGKTPVIATPITNDESMQLLMKKMERIEVAFNSLQTPTKTESVEKDNLKLLMLKIQPKNWDEVSKLHINPELITEVITELSDEKKVLNKGKVFVWL